MDNV
jgi:hypothetical protein